MLLTVVLVPQLLSRDARLQVLRAHVSEVARLAASSVEGDLHRQLIESQAGSPPDESMLAQARAPLLRLHRNWPEAIYVYTMGVDGGMPFFVLDTAQDPAFAASRKLKPSPYGEEFRIRPEYSSNWLNELAAGRAYVNEYFQHDDYGYFLSGHAPIRDDSGRVAGFAGVDFDLDYYIAEEARFRRIEFTSIAFALLLSLLLGFAYAHYRFTQQNQMRLHYESAMQDSLTGLLNRRGALSAIEAGWSDANIHSHAALLVDIDNFKAINDTHGHATGDEVVRTLAAALRGCLRPNDITARLGGDEFLVFAPDCDRSGAEKIASQLLEVVRQTAGPVGFRVSIGISVVTAAQGDFDRLYRQADTALYRAKGAGRDGYAFFSV
ncbi:MAG: GGDEF domain-containing protein [Proteobacteria bacterium]|nr:GGDEF domain-containing protein [Pseudomonadota bacterium]